MILFTSETSSSKRCLYYTLTSIFFAVFGAVYELFSHEVYSYYMIYAFLIPLILGVLPSALASIKHWRMPERVTSQLYAAGVLCLTVGCVVKGVLDIYGTTNSKIIIYPVVGIVLILVSCITNLKKGSE